MPHADWHKKPVLATILKEAIQKESAEEVVRLNELTDDYIQKIEENEAVYDEYYNQLMVVREQIEAVKKFWEDTRETRKKVGKAVKTALTAKKTAEASDKASTISMSLNPVIAAVQYAVKLLERLLKSEIDALLDITSVIEPSQNEFIAFSGGTITTTRADGSVSTMEVNGTFNDKIDALNERLKARKMARLKRKQKLEEKKRLRLEGIANRVEREAQEMLDEASDALAAADSEEGDVPKTYTR